MSITFFSNCPRERAPSVEHCLCAQMAPGWGGRATSTVLASHADPRCHHCYGTGLESVEIELSPSINLCNGNAALVLRALGLAPSDAGECDLHTARRAVIMASNRVPGATREPFVQYGAPRSNDDGSVELHPLRAFDPGLDAAGISDSVQQFSRFVEASAARGATSIYWG